ncbi:helix-turn-helix transcriptional regulator [Fluviicola sp.]|uniref:helix-turn-helix domain-containing protein n=1 Tax=Fluviicola sp. TaxID=1917219 RepID=UPI002602282F|nr:helix-turn-helix transcriptional regulator [Fluviicola sp.]
MNESEFIKIIGDNIVSRRIELGIKQIDLATSVGIEDSALRRIEKGKTNPTAKTLLKIAVALDVEVSYLVSMKK